MSKSKSEDKAAYRPPVPLPTRPERPGGAGWPSPTPAPISPSEDVGRTLRQILEPLDSVEKRLERIEQVLSQRQPL